MAMFFPKHASPTTTVLADGYTDDALASKYDNFRASRPYSRESLLSGTSLGSKVRLSQFSLLSRPDATLAEHEEHGGDHEDTHHFHQQNHREQKSLLQAHVIRMFAGQFSRSGSIIDLDDGISSMSQHLSPTTVPQSLLGKCKYYYDKYKIHRISACVCLILYSFLGAWLFYIIEHEYEKEVKGIERIALWKLRNETFGRITRANPRNFEEVFIEYEKKLHKVRLPECLDWDYWGALFYVGTLFTTIGYGNIAPRTTAGRALSVIYAIIGIPLVLAILSKCGKWLTTTLSAYWQQHRSRIKLKAKKTTNRLRGRKISKIENLEVGCLNSEETDEIESRTIPIWLALLICILFVCGCSSLFLIWETRWTFFTSLYFFCISLSTIGLGDIVPDHPHMFIIMFVLVIMGLSIVSMLLSVIQIKMEEWLYHLIKKIQQEYNRALENGELVDKDGLFRNVLSNEPQWMQWVAPSMLTGQQADKLEQKVEQFERLLKESKDVQTDVSVAFAGTQVEKFEQSMACDPMSDRILPQHQQTQWSKQTVENEEPKLRQQDHVMASKSYDYRDSISDATSLPLDSMSSPVPNKRTKQTCASCGQRTMVDDGAQTELAQFQIDEIAINLANLQTQRVRPPNVERSMATSINLDPPIDTKSEAVGVSQSDFKDSPNNNNKFGKLIDCAVGDDFENSLVDKSQNTSIISRVSTATSFDRIPMNEILRSMATSPISRENGGYRSFATSPIPTISIVEDETQTSIREHIDVSTDPCTSNNIDRSTATTPINNAMEDASTETFNSQMVDRKSSPLLIHNISQSTSPIDQEASDSTDYDDRSMQTSIGEWFGKIFQRKDQSQQTSISEELKKKQKRKKEKDRKDSNDTSQASSLNTDEALSDGSSKKNQKNLMSTSVTMSTQYSPPPGFHVDHLSEPASHRARSSSTSGIGTSIFEEDTRQEVIVQTDDSYLKIARRLDEYRNNKTQFLPVCAASPLSSKEVEPFKTDRPSERSHYYFGSNIRRRSLGRSMRRSGKNEMNHRDSQTGKSMDAEMLTEVLNSEKSRSISPNRPSSQKRGLLTRNPSLPNGISRGRVLDYISHHEKGIPNPATNRRSPVKIIRQYSLDQCNS